MQTLEKTLSQIKDEKQMTAFLKDLLTPAEMKEFQNRWGIAQCLNEKELSYRDIAQKFGTSVTTVTRVARFLKDEPYKGYASVLNKHHA